MTSQKMVKIDKTEKKMMIYQVEGIKGTNNGKIICLGYINKDEDFKDIELKLNDNETILEIYKDIFLKIYKCNISDSFLMKNKKLPLYGASITYQKKLIKGYLLSIGLSFEIKTDTNKIKSMNELMNMKLEGSFILELDLDSTYEILLTYDCYPMDGEKEIIKNIIDLVKEDTFKELINIALKKRDDERIKKLGVMHDLKTSIASDKFNAIVEKYKKGESLYFNKIAENEKPLKKKITYFDTEIKIKK